MRIDNIADLIAKLSPASPRCPPGTLRGVQVALTAI
jgi:hypothetical protein